MRALLWLIVLIPAVAVAVAGDASDPLLEALVAEAFESSPELKAARATETAARLRPGQARSLPDPMLSVLYVNDGWSPTLGERDMTTLGIMASQELPLFGERALRARGLERDADAAAWLVERRRLDLVAGVTRAYHELRLAREQTELSRDQEALWQEIEASVRARYASGQGSQVDVLRAQVEVTRGREESLRRETAAAVRLARLNRLAGRPLDQVLPETPPLAAVPLQGTADEWIARAEGESPEVQAAGLRIE